jgi:hypothetical protein
MEKLSHNQLDLLMSMHAGNHIDICTSIGRSLGKMTSKTALPYGFSKAVMNSLYTWGLLVDKEFQEYGLRWSRITISTNGILQLKKEGSII